MLWKEDLEEYSKLWNVCSPSYVEYVAENPASTTDPSVLNLIVISFFVDMIEGGAIFPQYFFEDEPSFISR